MDIKRMSVIRKINNKNGSLTVEVCICFPVFLCFFLLLAFFIRISCIHITLNHAVNETTKQLSTTCYPIVFLNELEDEFVEENETSGLLNYQEEFGNSKGFFNSDSVSENVFSQLLSGQVGKEELSGMVDSMMSDAGTSLEKGMKGFLVTQFKGKYFEIKSQAKYAAAAALIKKFCSGSFVDAKQINFLLVEIPQGNAEFQVKKDYPPYSQLCKEINYAPDVDDVVIVIEYRVKIPIPFLGKEIITRHMTVEKAWVHGSNGVYTTSGSDEKGETGQEGDRENGENDEDNKSQIVYITKTGEKYHENGCMYLSKSKVPVRLSDAEARGYHPCKVCVLKTAKDWRK